MISFATLGGLLFAAQAALAAPLAGRAGTYTNPLRQNGADPFVVYDHPSSKFWFVSTSYTDIRVTSSPTLDGLATAPQNVVYSTDETKSDGNTWAPELHKIGNQWYLYYSLHYNPFVLTGGSSPDGPYSNPVQLSTDWGIDGTVLSLNNDSYFVWSCLRPLTGYANPVQSICISKLTSPTAIDSGNIGVISQPDQPWEQIGTADVPAVNEGPNPLYWAGETYLTYSASFCGTASYSLGLLHHTGGDPVDPASWHKKTNGPVFASNNGEYGTGHNGNFLSPDGTQVWNVFHAVTNPQGSCGTDRATFALQLNTTNFDPAAGPIFGPIPPLGTVLPGPSGE